MDNRMRQLGYRLFHSESVSLFAIS